MYSNNKYEGIDPFAVRSIRKKARELVGRFGYTGSDIEDLEQELMLDYLQRLPNYDPTRASKDTYTNRVINHKVATLIESKTAVKRDYRLNGESLSGDIEDGEGNLTPRLELIDSLGCHRRLGWSDERSPEELDLKIDIDRVTSSLSPKQRELCERLRYQTMGEISQETGISRSALYERAWRIRARFEDSRLKEEYINNPDT